MINNKKGLSAVIVTLLLVMLSIVLVGIVFVVVNNVVGRGTSQAQTGFDCLSSSISVTAATCNQAGTNCNVTVKRGQGSDAIGGVTLVFYNAQDESGVNNTAGNIQTPASKRITNINASIANITKIDAAVYFLDNSGKVSTCSGTTEYTQVALV